MPGRILSVRRTLACLAFGAFAGTVVALTIAPRLGPLVARCTAGVLAPVWVWRILWPQDAAGTERLAREEPSTRITDDATIAACLVSIAAVIVAVVQANSRSNDAISIALVILSVLGTMVAWALVNWSLATGITTCTNRIVAAVGTSMRSRDHRPSTRTSHVSRSMTYGILPRALRSARETTSRLCSGCSVIRLRR